MTRLADRWDRRSESLRDGREGFTAQSATLILRKPQAVWDCLNSPGIDVLLHRGHLKTFHVPGTPETGLGKQTCMFIRGTSEVVDVTVSEIIDYEPPRRVSSKIVNSQVPMVEVQTIAELPGGCSFAVSLGTRIPIGSAAQAGRRLQGHIDEYVARVKAIVEAGAQAPETTAPTVSGS